MLALTPYLRILDRDHAVAINPTLADEGARLVAQIGTSIDRAIIAEGIAAGMRPDYCDAIPGFPDPLGARWLRFRAACARVERETTTDPNMRAYLRVVAVNADNEASARERNGRAG